MKQGSVLILGGYGNFGKRIAGALVSKGVPVVIAGRSRDKASALAALHQPHAGIAIGDVRSELPDMLERTQPSVVINTCGPFQTSDYAIAETCIAHGVHYIDLADGRSFVTGITALDDKALKNGVTIISGASTVPGLSSAVLDQYKSEFSRIDFLKFGISPGQQAERGLATTQGILTYVGKPLVSFPAIHRTVYGWQDMYRQDYPKLGKRWMANCDVPDLDLFPPHYGIGKIQFSAGLELGVMHIGLWLISWLVRLGAPLNLPKLAVPLLRISNWFNSFGTADGGMHMVIQGQGRDGTPHTRRWFIIAKDGYGPHIPTIPAIVLAERLVKGENMHHGAYPCIGLVSLADYLNELAPYPVTLIAE